MSAHSCPRLFEAEATRDGRLGEVERASFERHTQTCPACAREVKALDALARALREPVAEQADKLRARRERTRLLAAFDRELLAPKDATALRGRMAWAIGAVGLAVVAGVLGWPLYDRARQPAQGGASPAVVHADPATGWSERAEGDREVVVLEHGALSIRVDHAISARRLVVMLPDGELEDTGTTFTVSADGGRTTRVAVQEGSVQLRLRDLPAIAVAAGEVWTPATPLATASARASSNTSGEPSPVTPPHLAPVAPHAQPPRVATFSELAHDAAADFSGPMAALDRGDNRAAADGFARFLRSHESDARAEDAAYLRVIALQRCNDHDGMRAAALEYLRRYPAGFRRGEVKTLSQ
jgi:ferric-dicitrate binding protein FerR (iron transport regulator)